MQKNYTSCSRKIRSLAVLLFSSIVLNAQVTIGSNVAPNVGAILDLKETDGSEANSTKGLLLPRVELESLTNIQPITGETNSEKLTGYGGLTVYNNKTIETQNNRLCPGIHVWSGDQWIPLSPYPEWEIKKEVFSDIPVEFKPLDHNDPNSWPEGRDPQDYQLGSLGQFTDNRVGDVAQTYYYTRYYVGVTKREVTYKVKGNYSCDPAKVDDYEDSYITEEIVDVFEDGVWMSENLRAKANDAIRDNQEEKVVQLPSSPSYNSSRNSDAIEWGYPNKAQSQMKNGILYTWAAASNDSKATANEEGLAGEAGIVQGICPHGWHLPSDREWTDLENGIIRKTSLFSSTSDLGENDIIPYRSSSSAIDLDDWLRGNHRTAMLYKSPGKGTSTGNKCEDGGFNMLLTGEGDGGGTQSHTYNAYGWSRSSTGDADRIWNRRINYKDTGVYRKKEKRFKLMTVRCKRN